LFLYDAADGDDASKALENTFEMINAETQLMFASIAAFRFDLPQEICDLPFLTEQAKRNISD